MAIRNELLGGVNLVGGEILFDYDLDDTFDAAAYRLINKHDTAVTNNTSTNSIAYTASIAANTIKRFIEINVESYHKIQNDNTGGTRSGANTGIIDVYIGETGSEVLVKSFVENIHGAIELAGTTNQVSHKLYYEPSETEKTNGFNVQFRIRVAGIEPNGVGDNYSKYNSSYIMGA